MFEVAGIIAINDEICLCGLGRPSPKPLQWCISHLYSYPISLTTKHP